MEFALLQSRDPSETPSQAHKESPSIRGPSDCRVEDRSEQTDFFYLLARAAEWRLTCDSEAFWEVSRAQQSPDPVTRCVARKLLRLGDFERLSAG